MRFNEALRKVTLDFKQKLLGECLNGEHCPEGFGPGLIPHPLDPALGMHTGWWDHSAARHVAGVDPVAHPQLTGVLPDQHHGQPFARFIRAADFAAAYHDRSGLGVGVANRLYVTYLEVPLRCVVQRIGLMVNAINTGNFKLALYDSDGSYLPNNLICSVPSTSVASLSASNWRWFTTSTTPTINAGLYWVGFVCDTVFSAGVSGVNLAFILGGATWNDTGLFDGLWGMYYQSSAWDLPDPMVEIAGPQAHSVLIMGIEVTQP